MDVTFSQSPGGDACALALPRWRLSIIVASAALIVGMIGSGSALPLDDHEVFVARTAEEMLARGELIVPTFNDVPRINKPPLAYWLTMAVDAIGDGDGLISEQEARITPIFSGVVLALATLSIGCTLFNPTIGLLSALMLASSSGFVAYTHSARPDMLYAACCAAGCACFSRSWRRITGAAPQRTDSTSLNSNRLWPSLGWGWMGLAVLAKGPQLPLVLISTWAIGMAAIGQRRDIGRTLRPITGVLIAAAIALWWFVLVWSIVPGSGDRMERESLGRIFQTDGVTLARMFEPYYFYRIAGLIAPWIVPYVMALALPFIRQVRMPPAAKLLWWVSILTLAVMHVSISRRWYYLLPLMPVLCTLMAYASVAIGAALIQLRRIGWWKVFVCVHLAGCVIMASVWLGRNPPALQPPLAGVVELAAGIVIAMVWFAARPLTLTSPARSMAMAALAAAATWCVASVRASPWSQERFARRAFAQHIASIVPADEASLLGWQDDWQHEQYYLHRAIPTLHTTSELHAALRNRRDGYLLTSSIKRLDDSAQSRLHLLHQVEVEPGEIVTLWRIGGIDSEQVAEAREGRTHDAANRLSSVNGGKASSRALPLDACSLSRKKWDTCLH